MVRRIWLSLVFVSLLAIPCFVYGADVSTIATDTRYDTNAAAGITSIPKNEIRRLPDMIDNPKSQVGMWIPVAEPDPVVRDFNNTIQPAGGVFKNTGAAQDKYPYIIKEKATGKFYVYKNVKYNWYFENAGTEDNSGGTNGASGADVWTPFYKAAGAEKAVEYIKNFVTGSGDKVWDPKVYPNIHAKPFDSGISGDADTRGSTVLQEVGMLLTYDRAEAAVTGTTGDGYTGNADLSVIDPNSIPTAQLGAEPSTWVSSKKEVEPPAGWKLENGMKMTGYNRVYVEDYKSPTVKGTEVSIYRGVSGAWVEEKYTKATSKWDRINGITFEYEDDNPSAAASSDRLQASLNYECGNMDLFKLDNPYYNADDPVSEPFIYFTYLTPTYKMTYNETNQKWERIKISENPVKMDETIQYGPYVGPAKKGEEYYYYKNVDPTWSKKQATAANPDPVMDFIKNRYAYAINGKSLAAWVRGYCYFILDERNSGLLKVKMLNGYINTNKNTKSVSLDEKIPELAQMVKEYSDIGTEKGKAASADLAAFRSHLQAQGLSNINRFSYIEFKDGGRYCVGPIEFEKDKNTEVGPNDTGYDPKIKKGSWFVPGPRVLLPRHFCVSSMEWDSSLGGNKVAGQMATDSQNFYMGSDGKWHRAGDAADAGVPEELQVTTQNSNFIKKYGDTWMQQCPDCMFKVDMADCCGNTTNQVGFLKVLDGGQGNKPGLDVSISDSRTGNEQKVSVPNSQEGLEYGQNGSDKNDQLIVKDGNGQQVVNAGEVYNGDNDLTAKEISLQKWDQNAVSKPIGDELKNPDPIKNPDKVIYEDTRLEIKANAVGTTDRAYPHAGIGKMSFKIQQLDAAGAPTGKYELLEDDSGTKNDEIKKNVFDSTTNGKISEFKPNIRFFHIFRNPGLYRVEFEAANMPNEGDKFLAEATQKLMFTVKVLDLKSDTRVIEDKKEGQIINKD